MVSVREGEERRRPLEGPVTMGEFRKRLAEMTERVLEGEEVVVTRGHEPVARFVGLGQKKKRRPGMLKELLSANELAELGRAMEAPLSKRDQQLLEGAGTDDTGIWQGEPAEGS